MDQVIAEAAFFGRAKDQTTGSQVTLNFNLYRVHTVSTTSGGINIKCQSARQLQKGGPIGYVVNAGANSFNLVDNSSNLLVALAAGECCELALIDNATAAGVWIVVEGTANFVADPPVNLYFYICGGLPTGTYDIAQREYNAQLDVWTQRTDLPSPILDLEWGAAAVQGTSAYYVGMDDGSGSSTNHKRIYQYDPDVWTQKTSSTVRYAQAGAVTIGTSVFFFNGNSLDSYSTEEYVVGSDSWTARTVRTSGRNATWNPCAAANSKAVLTDGPLNEVDTYVVDTWTAKTSRPGASANRCTTTSKTNVCYVYGGNSNPSATFLANVYTYTEATDTWASLSNMGVGREDATACSIGSFNYIAGGKEGAAGASTTSASLRTDLNAEHAPATDTYISRAVVSPTDSGDGVYRAFNHGVAVTP